MLMPFDEMVRRARYNQPRLRQDYTTHFEDEILRRLQDPLSSDITEQVRDDIKKQIKESNATVLLINYIIQNTANEDQLEQTETQLKQIEEKFSTLEACLLDIVAKQIAPTLSEPANTGAPKAQSTAAMAIATHEHQPSGTPSEGNVGADKSHEDDRKLDRKPSSAAAIAAVAAIGAATAASIPTGTNPADDVPPNTPWCHFNVCYYCNCCLHLENQMAVSYTQGQVVQQIVTGGPINGEAAAGAVLSGRSGPLGAVGNSFAQHVFCEAICAHACPLESCTCSCPAITCDAVSSTMQYIGGATSNCADATAQACGTVAQNCGTATSSIVGNCCTFFGAGLQTAGAAVGSCLQATGATAGACLGGCGEAAACCCGVLIRGVIPF